jgi:hypothetical protein
MVFNDTIVSHSSTGIFFQLAFESSHGIFVDASVTINTECWCADDHGIQMNFKFVLSAWMVFALSLFE